MEESEETKAGITKKTEGNVLFAAKKFKEAIDCYRSALELIPDDKGLKHKGIIYCNMGAAHMQLVRNLM